MRIIVLIVSSILLFAPACFSASDAGFATSYVCSDLAGTYRWQATANIEHQEGDPDDIFILTEKGIGHYSGFKGEISWISRLRFKSTKDLVSPISVEKHVYDQNNKSLAIDTQEFDYINNKIVYTKQDDVKNKRIVREFNFKSDPVNRLVLSLYVQKFLENGIKKRRVDLLSTEPNIYSVSIKIIDEEIIELNDQKFPAYKICLDPNLGLLSIFKVFLPKAYTWHLAKNDFAWLKYKGSESDPTSIQVYIKTKD